MMRFVKIILTFILVIPFFGCATDSEEVNKQPRVPFVPHIFLEQESVIAFFEVTHIDEYKKLIPSIFSMPERPLCKYWSNIRDPKAVKKCEHGIF
jgi:hypothetical protein